MKLTKVQLHHFRSACEEEAECTLTVEENITCLIGISESGKSSVLEALQRFEQGHFVASDVPSSIMDSSPEGPADDLLMVSVTYFLDDDDLKGIADLPGIKELISSDHAVTFRRDYRGPIYILGIQSGKGPRISSIISRIRKRVQDLDRSLRAYKNAYNRVRTTGTPVSNTVSVRYTQLEDLAIEENIPHDLDWANNLKKRFEFLRRGLSAWPAATTTQISERIKTNCMDHISAIQADIDSLVPALEAQNALHFIYNKRPQFSLIAAEPSSWLRGEYSVEQILQKESPTEDPSLKSARRLLKLAKLDLARLSQRPDSRVPILLNQASNTATAALHRVWKQDSLSFKFEMSASSGMRGLLVYIQSDDHQGYPEHRSFGLRWFLEFFLLYAEIQESKEPIVALFDEPGIHLHLSGQQDLLRLLKRELSENAQVIYSTHLPGLVDTSAIGTIRGVLKESSPKKVTTILNEGYSLEHRRPTWEVMLKALGILGEEGLELGNWLVVEGVADQQYLHAMAKILARENDDAKKLLSGIVRIYAGHGVSSLHAICARHIANQSIFNVLLDSDGEGNKAAGYLRNRYCNGSSLFKEIIQINDIDYGEYHLMAKDGSVQEHELEDLFGVQLYQQMVNIVFSANGPTLEPFKHDRNPPSMIKRAAVQWLRRTGIADEDDIYLVAERFPAMLADGKIQVTEEVKNRFSSLITRILGGLETPE